jgi:LysR family cys regulon transcriptional activator
MQQRFNFLRGALHQLDANVGEQLAEGFSNVRRLADLFTNDASGVLTIATTHTQARYSLPPVAPARRERRRTARGRL